MAKVFMLGAHCQRSPLFWFGTSGLVCALLTLDVLAIWLSGAHATIENPCAGCSAGWQSTSDLTGGSECQHGPENDPDCPQPPNFDAQRDCWEMNGNKGNCKCFECGLAAGCEPDIQVYLAWCGQQDADHINGCNVGPDPNSVNDPLRQQRNSTVQGGGACNFGNNGYVNHTMCGISGGTYQSGCKTSSCTGMGQFTIISNGQRQKCVTVHDSHS